MSIISGTDEEKHEDNNTLAMNDFEFYSDASGLSLNKNHQFHESGVVCLGIQNQQVWWYSELLWPLNNTSNLNFYSQSSSLEAIGLFLPFLCMPDVLQGKSVIFWTDNSSLVYLWSKQKFFKQKPIYRLLETLKQISTFLSVQVFVRHVTRRSNRWAKLVDNLSRKRTTNRFDQKAIGCAKKDIYQGILCQWISQPEINLEDLLLNEICLKLKP